MVEKSAVMTKGGNNSSYVSHFLIPTFPCYSTSVFYTKQYYLYFKGNLPSVAGLAVCFLLSISMFSSHRLFKIATLLVILENQPARESTAINFNFIECPTWPYFQ